MKALIVFSSFIIVNLSIGQERLVPNPGVQLKFENKTIVDSVFRYENISLNGDTLFYSFRFKNKGTVPITFRAPIPMKEDSLVFCSYYPINPVRGKAIDSICFAIPAATANTPQTLEWNYTMNSNSSNMDTLSIHRVFQWSRPGVKYDTLRLLDSTVRIASSIDNKSRSLYVNVHENEKTSLVALHEFRKEHDVNFIYLEQSGERCLHFNFDKELLNPDPNRIYSDSGLVLTLGDGKEIGDSSFLATQRVANEILKVVDQFDIIIAMHNNTAENYSILSYQPDGGEAMNTKDLYINSLMDTDDFIYTTDSLFFEAFKSKGINVILQDNDKCVDDGSLSVYCGKKNKPYINIETEHGHLFVQLQLMKLTQEIISDRLLVK